MVTFGLDISHHQNLSLSLAQARQEGIEFVFLKAGEGGDYADPTFTTNLNEAKAAGQLTAAYWFIRASATPAAHVAKIKQTVPTSVPIIPDIEKAADGSWPTKAHSDACLAAIRAAGYKVPISYIPLWFWRDYWKSPPLAGWPPLWSSRYPDNVVGTLASEWAQVPASYWNGYGGLSVAVLQFTSSSRVAGYQPLDANAFRGTRAELEILLGQKEADHPMRNLVLGREPNGKVWVGDGLTRRWVQDQAELDGLVWHIKQNGGSGYINEGWKDLRVLGVDMGAFQFTRADNGQVLASYPLDMLGNIFQMLFFGSASEPWKGASLVSMLKDLTTRQMADVDEEELAASLASHGIGGATPAQVKAAVQEALNSARISTSDSPTE
jgi:GH25 family lysozyme M1 (1,4-beta-N-acetylmuramidase)